jgi:hypothetical protein
MLKVIIVVLPFLFFFILNSWEDAITFQLLNYEVTVIEVVFLLMYLLFIIKEDFKIYTKDGVKVLFLINLLVAFFLSHILINVFQESNVAIRSLFSLVEVYVPTLVLLTIEFDEKTKNLLAWLISIGLILIDIEVITFSSGAFIYEGIYGEFFTEELLLARIHTTIGAATSTGYMLLFLLLIVFLLPKTKLRTLTLFLTATAILLTLSRGPILSLCVFGIVYFVKHLRINLSRSKKGIFITFIIILFLVILISSLGIPQYILARFSGSGRARLSNLERIERLQKAEKDFVESENYLVGKSYGSFLPRFRRQPPVEAQNILSYNPHNSFLVLLNEVGLLGLFFIIVIAFIVIKELYKKNDRAFVTIFLFSVLVFLMFETLIFSFRYMYPVVLLLAIQFNSERACRVEA